MDIEKRSWRRRVAIGLGLAVLLGFAGVGVVVTIRYGRGRLGAASRARIRQLVRMPMSKLPGPPRQHDVVPFTLGQNDSALMTGMDDVENERWCDVAGNFYSSAFVDRFSYERPGQRGPRVRIRIEPHAPTLRGRLEAQGLKPNFAYQIKLRGLPAHRANFEAIGHVGRWRLPGPGTNYTDDDYRTYPNKEAVEAYILFDYFVTDHNGDAVREFELDSSLHVLWRASYRYAEAVHFEDMVPLTMDVGNAEVYAKPKTEPANEWIWAEREYTRYRDADDVMRLPPGHYEAELVLTEESFHAREKDGGYWATVYLCPINFTVTAEETGADVL